MNNQEMTDSIAMINFAPSGTIIYNVIGLGSPFGMPEFRVAFLIKEELARINMIQEETIHVEIRSATMVLDDVVLVPLLIRINNNPNLTYAGWLNYYESDAAKEYFNYLTRQESLYILFFTGDAKPERKYIVNNSLQLGFKMHIQQLKNRIPWSMEDFDYVKSKMQKKYPTPVSLWDGIKKNIEAK